ncbi:MAG: hypothetical protein SGBAC_005327 [Bacillariaceae sp.]
MGTKEKTIAIVGGGPVGMTFALLISEYAKTKKELVKITIHEKRWTTATDGTIVWMGEEDNNNRRYQVVTLQSQVWSLLPKQVQDALFPEGSDQYIEMWPFGDDSPEDVGAPRNIRIKVLEDVLLQQLQTPQSADIILVPSAFNQDDSSNFRFVVFACGNAGIAEKMFSFPKVGYASGDSRLKESVLGIYVEAPKGQDAIGVSEAEGMLLTVSQNRLLLNPLGSKMGYLNIWLTEDEDTQAVGMVQDEVQGVKASPCLQGSPCVMRATFGRDGTTKFCCATHSEAIFLPFASQQSPLWRRIEAALALYKIDVANVKNFTKFTLGPYCQRTRFHTRVNTPEGTAEGTPVDAFLLGDAAIQVSFRAGRGLNTGLKGAISLATAIIEASTRPREADFSEYVGFMHGLQDREMRIRTLQMMKFKNQTVIERIRRGLYENDSSHMQRLESFESTLEQRARAFTEERLPPNIAVPNFESLKAHIRQLVANDDSKGTHKELVRVLAASNAWNLGQVNGKECAPRPFIPRKTTTKEFIANTLANANGSERRPVRPPEVRVVQMAPDLEAEAAPDLEAEASPEVEQERKNPLSVRLASISATIGCFIGAAICFAALSLIFDLSGTTDIAVENQESVPIYIGIQVAYWALPVYIGVEKGWFRELGLEPIIRDYPSGGPQVKAAIEDAEWEIGMTGSSPNIIAGQSGISTIGISNDESRANAFVATSDAPIFPPSELQKPISTTANSTGDFIVNKCLRENNLREQAKFVYTSQQGIVSNLNTGTSDYGGLWAPSLYNYLREHDGSATVCSAYSVGARVFGGIMVRDDYALKYEASVLKFLAIFLRGVTFIQDNANQEEATALAKKFYTEYGVEIEESDINEDFSSRPLFNLLEQINMLKRESRNGNRSVVDNVYASLSDFLVKSGVLSEAPDPTGYITDAFMKKVKQDDFLADYSFYEK